MIVKRQKFQGEEKINQWIKKLKLLGTFKNWLRKYNLPSDWIENVCNEIISYPVAYDNRISTNEIWETTIECGGNIIDEFRIIYNKNKDVFEKWKDRKIDEEKDVTSLIKTSILEILKKNLDNQMSEKDVLEWLELELIGDWTKNEEKNYFKTSLKALKDYTNEIIKILNT